MSTSSRIFPPILVATLVLCVGVAQGIRCYKCGQYNEGVGSITPCINFTAHMDLKDCPPNFEWCFKYVSGGSTVRDCQETCVEKEAWNTRTYCCQQDGCNSGPSLTSNSNGYVVVLTLTMLVLIIERSLRG